MPCVYVNMNRPKGILSRLPQLPAHNWLITDLECYDDCGWDGCEKWGKQTLFLTDEELRHDVESYNMLIVWGVFSAIPSEYTMEDICKYPFPESQIPYYMSSKIVPQHPLAFLELYFDDGDFTFVSSHDAALLKPLFRLRCEVHDEEAENRIMNAHLRRIQDILRKEVPNLSPQIANEVQWNVWRAFFKGKSDSVSDDTLRPCITKAYHKELKIGQQRKYFDTLGDPYLQD